VAQDAPPAPPPLKGPTVKLAYRFRPGAVSRYRFTGSGTMSMDLSRAAGPGLGAGLGVMPVEVAMQFDVVRKVTSVAADGSAAIAQSVENATTTLKLNGQPLPMGNLPAGQARAGETIQARLSPTGQVLSVQGGGNPAAPGMLGGGDLTRLFGAGAPGLELLVLPDRPMEVGEQWEDQVTLQMPLPIPGGLAGTGLPPTQRRRRHTLKEIRQQGARRIAVIDSTIDAEPPAPAVAPPPAGEGAGAPGPAGPPLSHSVIGTHSFDVASGEYQSGESVTRFSVQVPMALVGAAGAASPPLVGVEGSFTMRVALQPPAAPKPAPPARAPVRGGAR
jgi:hypothetical protein